MVIKDTIILTIFIPFLIMQYEHYERVFAGERWRVLLAAGAHPQRPLWASTGVKDPSYDDTRYVVDLVTRGLVNTMPQATLAAVADHGTIRGDTIRPFYAEAHQVLDDLAAVGVDYDDVVDLLENQGVTKFEKSWALVSGELSDRLGRHIPPTHQCRHVATP